MKLYLTVIGAAMLVISVVNIIFDTAAWYNIIIFVVVCTALQFALDGTIAIIINKMPDKLFGAENPLYNVSEFEKTLYKSRNKWYNNIVKKISLGGNYENRI